MTIMDFSRIIAPYDETTFFSSYWERAPLHIAKGAANPDGGLLTLEAMNKLLSEVVFRVDECKVARDGGIVPASVYAAEPGMRVMERSIVDYVDTTKLLALFEQGATLVFAQLNHKHLPLQLLKAGLERHLSAGVVTNVFLSNRSSQGFSLHYDSHDVFVLQLHGSKIWRLHDSPIDLPSKSQPFGRTPVRPGPLASEVHLRAGDVLYVPRGYFHEARTTDDISLHVTLGVHPYLWMDYIGDLLQQLSLHAVALRRSVPRDFMAATPEAQLTMVKDALDEAIRDPAFARLTGTVYAGAIHRKLAAGTTALRDHLREIVRSHDLTPHSRITKRNHAVPIVVARKADKVMAALLGQAVPFPISHEPMLEAVRDRQSFTASELPGPLPLDQKLDFVRRLIGLGLLVAEREPAPRRIPVPA
jgi:ribosomal protein L16 Arg81 hydroxylase